MRTKLVFFAFTLLLSGYLFSQDQNESNISLLNDNYSFMNPSTQFGMQLGSSFSTGYGGGMFSQSIAPYLTFRPGQNFSLMVGSVLSTSSFQGGTASLGVPVSAPNRFLSTTVYAFGAYQLNPRLTITGGAWTERNNMGAMMFNDFPGQMNPQAFNMNASGMVMGLDYKISEKFSIGAGVNISNGYNPFNPYTSPGSFYNSPFNRRSGW